MKILVVGAGPMAGAHILALQHLGVPFEVLGRGEASAAAFENNYKVPVRRGGVPALSSDEAASFTGAVVAVNIEALAPVALALLQKGVRRFLIEKPAGLHPAEIKRLSEDLEAVGAEAYVAYNRRFYASTREAARLIAEDGGVTSFHFEFTEIEARILSVPRPAEVLANFTLGNSSHVVDLAFFLGGQPARSSGYTAGALVWHPSAAVFAGSGVTKLGALFTWRADWSSAGRWSLDLRTPRRRLLMEPLEVLASQTKGSFQIERVEIDDGDDKVGKPGVLAQMRAFLSLGQDNSVLPSLKEHAHSLDRQFLPVFAPK